VKSKVLMFALISLFSVPALPCDDCTTVKNSAGKQVKMHGPMKLYIHESVPAEFIPAITNAVKSWEGFMGEPVFEIVGVLNGPAAANKDGVSVIYYMTTWEDHKSSEQARATIYWQDTEISEGDIRVNGKNFLFSTSEKDMQNKVDFESLMLRQLGHLLGLAHDNSKDSMMKDTLPAGVLRREINAPECVRWL
jgi:hypothetical protein